MKKGLLLLTNKFPYGNQESFLEIELPFLTDAFDRVVICPVNQHADEPDRRPLPLHTEVLIFPGASLFDNVYNFFPFLKWYARGVWKEKRVWRYVYHIMGYSTYMFREIFLSNHLSAFLDKERNIEWTGYSYWFLEGCLGISLLRSKGYFHHSISRAHGYDLYDFRQGGLIPFRNLKINYLNKVAVISHQGCEYLKQRVTSRDKIHLSMLGSKFGGLGPFTTTEPLRIVSCSNVVPVKRVPLIAEVILGLKYPIEWIHFGDGEDMKKLKNSIASANSDVEVKLMRHVPNKQVVSFYQHNVVHLFINLSLSEGLPVSIMEAISFGIPVIAMNVGGISEIVNSRTGRLLSENASLIEIQETVISFLTSQAKSETFRKDVHQFWRDNFDADKNYPEFVQNFLISQ